MMDPLFGRSASIVQQPYRVIIVGAGISGLSTAYALVQAGLEVLVLERANRVGGYIWTEQTPEGYLIEHGPNSLLNLNPEVDRLCQELNLESERVFQEPVSRYRYIVKDRRLVPVPSRALQFPMTPLLSRKDKWRVLAEPFVPSRVRPDIDESVADFIRRRFGSGILDYAVEPFVAGIFAGDPECLSMTSNFPWVASLERTYGSVVTGLVRTRWARRKPAAPIRVFSFRGGVGRLPEALHQSLGPRVHTGVRVDAVRSEFRDGLARFIVDTEVAGEAQRFTADRLVLATPADVAGRLVSTLSPLLADHLEQIPYAPVGLVHVGAGCDALSRFPKGAGCLVPKREGLPILGSLWSSNVYPERAPQGRVLLTNYLGGVRNSDVLKWSDEDLTRLVLDALRELIGLEGPPDFIRVLRHPRAIPQYLLGHGERVQAIERLVRQVPGVYLAGNYLRGVSVRDCLTEGVTLAKRIVEDMRSVESDGCTPVTAARTVASSQHLS